MINKTEGLERIFTASPARAAVGIVAGYLANRTAGKAR
jgi:hypothetical protein